MALQELARGVEEAPSPTTRYVDYNWNSWLRPEMLQVLMLVYMAYLRTGTFFTAQRWRVRVFSHSKTSPKAPSPNCRSTR